MAQTLYRIVSLAEWKDFQSKKGFATSKNTIEGKQFFKTEHAVRDFHRRSITQKFSPPYEKLIIITVENECLKESKGGEQLLDGFMAITIPEDYLPTFNNCYKFERCETL